ncbi:MAG: hypothetical protein AAF483_27610 [Planctomycetota bacterium]
MKKLALLAVLLFASTGCRGGILDRLFHGDLFYGDNCGTCGYQLPAGPNCNSCGTVGAGYGAYEGDVVLGNDYYGPAVIESPTTAPQNVTPLP